MIRLQFVTEAGFTSALIRWFGGDIGWSHVDAVLPDDDPDHPGWLLGARSERDCTPDELYVCEPGVQIRPPRYARFTDRAVIELPASAEETDRFYAILKRQVGKPYSAETIEGLLIGRDLDDHQAWICDALQAWCACEAGILPRQLFRYIRRLTPNSLYLICLTACALRGERT